MFNYPPLRLINGSETLSTAITWIPLVNNLWFSESLEQTFQMMSSSLSQFGHTMDIAHGPSLKNENYGPNNDLKGFSLSFQKSEKMWTLDQRY